jgi:hypothetical protein
VASLGRETVERTSALSIAVRIPLLSVRRQLRDLAERPGEPAAGAVADALARAADRSQIARLLKEANEGRWEVLEWLAAMPLEQEGVTPSQLPAPPDEDHPDARMWYALAVARLGDFRPIDAFLAGCEPEAKIFYGNPWTPYARIAAIRPLPAAFHAHLCEALQSCDHIHEPSRESMARIIIGAATGSADAEGHPVHHDEESEILVPGSRGATAPTTKPWDKAVAAVRELLEPSDGHRERIDFVSDPENNTARFVTQIIGEANRRESDQSIPMPMCALCNGVVYLLSLLPRAEDWPVIAVVAMQLGTSPTALDDEQIAWVIAQAPIRRMISELAEMLTGQRPQAERLRILEIAIAAAEYRAGRGGSPYRGAGGDTGGAPTGRGALIDDEEPADMAPSADKRGRFDDELGIRCPTSDVDKRRVHAAILQGGQKRRAFVTGAENVIRCWISLPERGAAVADKDIPSIHIPPEGLPLLVQLYWRDGSGKDHTDSKPMLLPAERTARSGDCDLHVYVPEGERYVSAEIVFRYRGRIFEMVRVEAFALTSAEVEGPQHEILVRVHTSRRETVEMPDSQPVGATLVFGNDRSGSSQGGPPHQLRASCSLRAFGREGVKNFDLRDANEAIKWLNETLFATEKLVVRRRAVPGLVSAGEGSAVLPEDTLDADDRDVCRLLRDMARHGAGLYNHLLAEGFVDPGERIQVLNHEPNTYVPLEFVYDRGYPVSNAKVCTSGLEALRSDAEACPVCTVPAREEERASAPVICPFGFWSIRKVIERVAPGVSTNASTPRAKRRGLPVLDSAAFASSHSVPEDERKATQEALRQRFDRLFLVDDWHQWREAIKEHPCLLLLMPHHGIEGKLDYLEIGDERLPEDLGRLSRAQLLRQYVNADGRDPGPIVLVLGCQTAARTETGYVQITHLIQEQHASIVLGTLAEILGRHAAPVARELIAELVGIKDTQTDFGTVMRRVRRRMLARGFLMALCLVALGDAEWRLTPRPDSGQTSRP